MNESTLGLSISDRGVQAVEVTRDGASPTLLAIDEWDNTLSAGEKAPDAGGVERFTEYLAVFQKVNRVKARDVSVALDTSYLFLNHLPIDDDASDLKIREQIKWELSMFFPDAGTADFISDFHRLKHFPDLQKSQILGVSVRRRAAQAIGKVLDDLGLSLNILDADHFSAENALRINYPDSFRRTLALVGVKENRLDISLLKNGTLEAYSYRVVHSNQEIVDEIGRLSRETEGIFSITAYGPYLDKDLLLQIRRGSALLVEALNPLRHVSVSDTLRLADHLTVPSYRFASAVGVALRRD
jgi:Tfp pilus assembly PilM family ATPase